MKKSQLSFEISYCNVLQIFAEIIIGGIIAFVGAGALNPGLVKASIPPKEVRIVTYPAPSEEIDSTEYLVKVNGKSVNVYLAKTQHHDKKYYFAYFDFSGQVDVKVSSSLSLKNVAILPESCGIAPVIRSPDTLEFTVRQPFKISIERDGQNSPLLLFGNPLEENAPKQGDPGVVFFGPGIHHPGKIFLTSNQTLYVAGGAVVKGGVYAQGNHIKILGHGIIDGNDYPWKAGPTPFMLHLDKCNDVIIKDVILRGSWFFTIVPSGCNHVSINNVKICGSRVDNDDGIDPINSSDINIHNCFIRTDDDCIAPKGILGYNKKNCENIVVTNCSLWTDRAHIFRIGFESEAYAMQDITAKNINVLHFKDDFRLPNWFNGAAIILLQPSNNMPMRRLHFENFIINDDGTDCYLIEVKPMSTGVWKISEKNELFTEMIRYKDPGHYVKNCLFKDISLIGKAGTRSGMINISGTDSSHTVKNITLKNIVRFGESTYSTSPEVKIGSYVSHIRFKNDCDQN